MDCFSNRRYYQCGMQKQRNPKKQKRRIKRKKNPRKISLLSPSSLPPLSLLSPSSLPPLPALYPGKERRNFNFFFMPEIFSNTGRDSLRAKARSRWHCEDKTTTRTNNHRSNKIREKRKGRKNENKKREFFGLNYDLLYFLIPGRFSNKYRQGQPARQSPRTVALRGHSNNQVK
jgi:hypothetical protein